MGGVPSTRKLESSFCFLLSGCVHPPPPPPPPANLIDLSTCVKIQFSKETHVFVKGQENAT